MQRLLARISGESAPPLLGRYRLIELLGAGSHGQVYEAWDLRLQRRVALKVLTEPDERSLQEARALASVDAPGVVRIHEFVEDRECTAVVMQFVRGRTVDVWAHSGGRGWRTVVACMADVADALACVHQAGIVHGDVKPSNIVVGDDGAPVLIDFSLAGRHEELDSPAGTPRYMAPEARRDRPTAHSDQYSFFATLRALLEPATASSPESTASSRDGSSVGRGSAVQGHAMPRALLRLVTRGTAEDPTERMSSMAEAARALRGLLSRRRRAVALATVGAVVVGAWGWAAARDARCRGAAESGIEIPTASDDEPAPVGDALRAGVHNWERAAHSQCRAHPLGSLPAATASPCLELQRRRLAMLAETLASDPRRVNAHGDALVSLIPNIDACEDDPLLRRAGWSADVDHEALLRTQQQLQRAALALEFQPAQAATMLADVEATASTPPCTWRPDLELLNARHSHTEGHAEDAVEHAVSAAVEAERCGRDALQIVARGQVVTHLVTAGRVEQARDWLRLLEAGLQRSPSAAEEAWRLDYARADLAYAQVRIADAHRSYAAAERFLADRGRPDSTVAHKRIAMLGLLDDPEAEVQATDFIQRQTERWGASHPAVAEAWGLHGTVLTYQRRLDDAAPSLRRATELWSQWSDEFAMEYRASQLDLGVALQLSEPEEAAELLRSFVDFAEHELPSSTMTAEALTVLARVEWKLGDDARALATARRAAALLSEADGPDAATTLQARALEGRLVGVNGDRDAGFSIACPAARELHTPGKHPPTIAAGALLSCLKVAEGASEQTVAEFAQQPWLREAVNACQGLSVCEPIARRYAALGPPGGQARGTLPAGGTP